MSRNCIMSNCSDASASQKRLRRISSHYSSSQNTPQLFSGLAEIETIQTKIRFKRQSLIPNVLSQSDSLTVSLILSFIHILSFKPIKLITDSTPEQNHNRLEPLRIANEEEEFEESFETTKLCFKSVAAWLIAGFCFVFLILGIIIIMLCRPKFFESLFDRIHQKMFGKS